MRRQTEEWYPTGIQVAGEKKIKIESRRRQQKSLQQEISGVRTLVKDGYAPRNQLLQLERSSSESSAAISELLGNIERTTRTVLEMRQRKNYRFVGKL